ncbi:MAG: carbon-nitrogen hydrolase family protein [Planctomycetota bacterium]|jgi:predicted amidohydrolase
MDSRFKLAMGQMLVEGGQVEANLQRAERMIQEASTAGCKVIVLPECLDVGWTDPAARQLAEPIPGERSERLCIAGCEANIFVAAGLTERLGDRIYNSAVLISPEGRVLLRHRKINILDIAQGLYAVGDSLGIVETSLGTVGLNICADNSPKTLALGRSLGRMGAKLLVSPSAWAMEADHDNEKQPYGENWKNSYTTLAREFDMTVVGVSNVGWIRGGPWEGRKCIGCSLGVAPGGKILVEGPYGEAAEKLLFVDIEIAD